MLFIRLSFFITLVAVAIATADDPTQKRQDDSIDCDIVVRQLTDLHAPLDLNRSSELDAGVFKIFFWLFNYPNLYVMLHQSWKICWPTRRIPMWKAWTTSWWVLVLSCNKFNIG
jgi:hypothetical protein